MIIKHTYVLEEDQKLKPHQGYHALELTLETNVDHPVQMSVIQRFQWWLMPVYAHVEVKITGDDNEGNVFIVVSGLLIFPLFPCEVCGHWAVNPRAGDLRVNHDLACPHYDLPRDVREVVSELLGHVRGVVVHSNPGKIRAYNRAAWMIGLQDVIEEGDTI